MRDEGWTGLREIQDTAIRSILGCGNDVIIMAGTASGKTEAAFLPLLTEAAGMTGGGLRLLYISPLKASSTTSSDASNRSASGSACLSHGGTAMLPKDRRRGFLRRQRALR